MLRPSARSKLRGTSAGSGASRQVTCSNSERRARSARLSSRARGAAGTRPLFEATFREQGLPERIRIDNGAPFASVGIGGLSELSVWWIKLGIRPERIEPGRSEEGGVG